MPTILLTVGVLLLIAAIVIFAVAVPKADAVYKRVLEIICAVLMLVLAGLCGLYYWLSRDTYPNYFLFDRVKKKNIPVEKLKFTRVSERMTFLIGQIAESPEALWKSDVLLHGDETYGFRCVYKPLVAYKMLLDLSEQRVESGYWGYFKQAPQANIDALLEALGKAGEKRLVDVFRVIISREPFDDEKVKEFLIRNQPYFRSKMLSYVKRHIELFY